LILLNPTGMGVRNDDFGSGKFKARRTNAAGKVYPHSGTDYLCVPGQAVVAPISARYIRAARPYADSELYSGAVFISDDIEIKMFYFMPTIKLGSEVCRGQVIGYAQDIAARYNSDSESRKMLSHVHLEITRINPEIIMINESQQLWKELS